MCLVNCSKCDENFFIPHSVPFQPIQRSSSKKEVLLGRKEFDRELLGDANLSANFDELLLCYQDYPNLEHEKEYLYYLLHYNLFEEFRKLFPEIWTPVSGRI